MSVTTMMATQGVPPPSLPLSPVAWVKQYSPKKNQDFLINAGPTRLLTNQIVLKSGKGSGSGRGSQI